MAQQASNNRWLNNPLRRVGHDQLLHTMRAAVGESHPAYRDYRERLASRPSAPDAKGTDCARNGR